MKLQDVSPNEIYRVSASHKTLIYVWNNMAKKNHRILIYEIIAKSKETKMPFLPDFDLKVFKIPILNLPLYMNLPFKSVNFDLLLKGDPLIKIESPEIFSRWVMAS